VQHVQLEQRLRLRHLLPGRLQDAAHLLADVVLTEHQAGR
jgi:hypothetical protein